MRDGLVDTLQDAARAVEEAGLAEDLRAVGFWAAVHLGTDESAATSTAATAPTPQLDHRQGDVLQSLADKLGLRRDSVEAVYYLDDGSRPTLGLSASRLGRRTAEAARRVALLVAVARQFDGNEEFTPTSEIRKVCQDFNVFDTGNFAKTLLAMTDVFHFQGTGPSRKVRVVKPGYEQATKLVKELAS